MRTKLEEAAAYRPGGGGPRGGRPAGTGAGDVKVRGLFEMLGCEAEITPGA
jgi:hypothetical protein